MKKIKFNRGVQEIKNFFHLILAGLANIYYEFPSRHIKVIGITGTDGKTTTTHLIYHILKYAGKKVSMISTVAAIADDKKFETGFHTTTPNPFFIQKLLKSAVNRKDEYFILETTSHALDQNRVFGINFFIGILTNVTHEHLDYHVSYPDYLETKAKLLLSSKTAIINKDDCSFNQIKQILNKKDIKFLTYGWKKKADFKMNFDLNLTDFNKSNYLAAYSVCKILGLSDNIFLQSLSTFQLPPGRLDLVYDRDFKIIIDFAHTPNAIGQVLKAVREIHFKKKGRLIHVFGSAGLRDCSKRSLMGKASGQYSDLVILTEEDYRTEDPLKICQQIAKGLKDKGFKFIHKEQLNQKLKKAYSIIIDRNQAIQKAVEIVSSGDVIVTTGKGHEQSLCRGKKEYQWSEYDAVRQANLKS